MPAPSISEAAILPCKERSWASICLLAYQAVGRNTWGVLRRQFVGVPNERHRGQAVRCLCPIAHASRTSPTLSHGDHRPPASSGAGMHAIGGSRRHADSPIRATHALVVARLVVGTL